MLYGADCPLHGDLRSPASTSTIRRQVWCKTCNKGLNITHYLRGTVATRKESNFFLRFSPIISSPPPSLLIAMIRPPATTLSTSPFCPLDQQPAAQTGGSMKALNSSFSDFILSYLQTDQGWATWMETKRDQRAQNSSVKALNSTVWDFILSYSSCKDDQRWATWMEMKRENRRRKAQWKL